MHDAIKRAGATSPHARLSFIAPMSHSGPFRCECGRIHADQLDGPSNDLLPYIDTTGVTALNEAEHGACRRVFKPWDTRLDPGPALESEEDDPQLLIHVPFTCPVKIRALTVMGGADGSAPSQLRAFVNREGFDFSDAEQTAPVQQWDLADDPIGAIEYPTQFSKFQNVSRLTLYIPENHGADHTVITYIGLSGVSTRYKREAVATVYELRGAPELNPLKEQAGPQLGL